MTVETSTNLPLSSEQIMVLKNLQPIGFDLDGVIVSLAPSAIAYYNETHGTNYGISDLTEPWRMADWYSAHWGCSRKEGIEQTTRFWNDPRSIEGSGLIPGASEVLDLLEALRIEHYFITSRPFYTINSTNNWFQRNRAGVGLDRLKIQTTETYNRSHKMEVISESGVKVHFEDMPEHALHIAESTQALVVMVGHPWNRDCPPHKRILRVDDIGKEGSLRHAFDKLLSHMVAHS